MNDVLTIGNDVYQIDIKGQKGALWTYRLEPSGEAQGGPPRSPCTPPREVPPCGVCSLEAPGAPWALHGRHGQPTRAELTCCPNSRRRRL